MTVREKLIDFELVPLGLRGQQIISAVVRQSGNGGTRADAIIFTGGANFLTGTGTVGSFTMISGGTFAPGSGTAGSSMTVSGNLAFQSGAKDQISCSHSALATIPGFLNKFEVAQIMYLRPEKVEIAAALIPRYVCIPLFAALVLCWAVMSLVHSSHFLGN